MEYLNFKPHIEKVTKQIVRATGILWRVGRFLPVESMTTLYHALIQPHLLYGLAIWGSPVFCDAQKQLQILQNNAVRAIVGSRKYDHVFKKKLSECNGFALRLLVKIYIFHTKSDSSKLH